MRALRDTFLFLTVCLAGCGVHRPDWADRYSVEAGQQADMYLAAHFTKCDDSHYGRYVAPPGHAMTGTDRANGVEWVGSNVVSFDSFRVYDKGLWSGWQ